LTSPGTDEPVEVAEAAALLAPLDQASGLLLAVSGGPDSMGLLLLVARWARQGTHPPVHVATVDHGLRPESAQEAAAVGLWAKAQGLPHQTLVWQGGKPVTRLQERAREARYALLAAHADRIGASHLVLAQHADDAAETVLFRLLRGSGIDGLAGMPAWSARGGLIVVRPLIDLPKSRLVATCAAAGQAFFRDPSNEDERFARARLRSAMPGLARAGLDRDALLRLGRRAARAKQALDHAASAAAAALVAVRHKGYFEANLAALADMPDEIALRLLRAEIEAVGGDVPPPRLDRLEMLVDRLLRALRRGERYKASLAATIVMLDVQGKVMIAREKGRHRPRHRSP
jgi:tRNA(Ile)-lysidine synthase